MATRKDLVIALYRKHPKHYRDLSRINTPKAMKKRQIELRNRIAARPPKEQTVDNLTHKRDSIEYRLLIMKRVLFSNSRAMPLQLGLTRMMIECTAYCSGVDETHAQRDARKEDHITMLLELELSRTDVTDDEIRAMIAA